MSENLIVLLLSAGSLLWCLGGSGVPPLGKNWRRIVWPLICAGLLLFSGTSLLQSFGVCLGLILACILPYGDSTPWPVRILVFLALPAPALVLNLNAWPWVLAGGALITGLFAASRKWNFFTQKFFEFGAGAVQAGVIVLAKLM